MRDNTLSKLRAFLERVVEGQLAALVADDFVSTAINLNADYAGRRHRDGNNEGPSVIRAVGKFQGGKLRYWPSDIKRNPRPDLDTLKQSDASIFDLKKNTTIFDGNRAHEVEDFTGERYSIVFFTAGGYLKLPSDKADYLKKLGMPFPTPKTMKDLKAATTKLIEGKTSLDKVKKTMLKKK